MRKYINSILLLSVTGAFLSGILLFQHYYPETDLGPISCGKGIVNDCIAVGQSSYSSLFGIPLAAYGIAYYVILVFMMLIADYARDKYYRTFMGIAFMMVSASVTADIVLASILIYLQESCTFCLATYAVNILTLLIIILYLKNNTTVSEVKQTLSDFLRPGSSDEKAALSLLVLFFFFLTFSVFAANNIIKIRSEGQAIPPRKLNSLVADFYRQKKELPVFPKSRLIVGNKKAPVKIYAFTDFLCSACYKLFEAEKYILSKYKNKVQIIYYHYPLDSECNTYMDSPVYKNSCIASKAMEAAADAGFFQEYFYTHFSNYRKYGKNFDEVQALKSLKDVFEKFSISQKARDRFAESMKNSKESAIIKRDIELAEKNMIEATPTFYLAGRKIVGVPPKEMIDLIIMKELSAISD